MNQHRRLTMFGLLFTGLIFPAWLLIAEDKPTETTDALLLRRIDELEARVKELEEKLAKPYYMITTPLPQGTLHTAPGTSNLPPNAVPQEINGLKYYHLLLNDDQTTTSAVPPVTVVPAK